MVWCSVIRQMFAIPSCITTAQTSARLVGSVASLSASSATLSQPSFFSSTNCRCSSRSSVWLWFRPTNSFSSATWPATCSWLLPASKSVRVTRIVSVVCTRFDDVAPVADAVVTLRTAAARSVSSGRIRLYACHMSSGSSGSSVAVPAPVRRSMLCLMRRMVSRVR